MERLNYLALSIQNIGMTPGISQGCFQHPKDVVVQKYF